MRVGAANTLHAAGRRAAVCGRPFQCNHTCSRQRTQRYRQTISCQAEPVRKTALVTGANSGIGFVAAMELAKQGYMTVL